MNRILIALIGLLPWQLGAQEEAIAVTNQFVGFLKDEDFKNAHALFDKEIKEGFPVETFEQMWGQVTGKCGKLKKFAHNCHEKVEADYHVYTSCQFKKADFDIKAIISPSNLVKSFTMSPPYDCAGNDNSAYQKPSYDYPDLYVEEEVVFVSDKFKIPGTLTYPKLQEAKSVVILVHGSGPNNRDEELGPNKMFRDLAVGLSAKGHAVLRYDKRTMLTDQFSAEDMNNFTIDFEVVDDIHSAISFVKLHEKTKNSPVVLIGHSLGGMMVQKVGISNDAVKGMILMAGPAGRFEDLLPYQYEYILGLDGKISKDEQKTIDEITRQVENLKTNLTKETPTEDLPLSIPASYWLSLKDYDQIELAKKFKGPIMVMNGERDYQVPMSEFQKWKEALSEKENVEFATGPKLNHFFLTGEGKPSPADYDIASNVPEAVIYAISDWLDKITK
jgi:uncharacterized protein